MEIRSEDRTGFFRISTIAPQEVVDYEIFVGVEVSAHGYAGRTTTWLDLRQVSEFAAELRTLDWQRQMKRLELPGTDLRFSMAVVPLNRLGHVALEVHMKTFLDLLDPTLALAMRLDPTELPSLAAGLDGLIAEYQGLGGGYPPDRCPETT